MYCRRVTRIVHILIEQSIAIWPNVALAMVPVNQDTNRIAETAAKVENLLESEPTRLTVHLVRHAKDRARYTPPLLVEGVVVRAKRDDVKDDLVRPVSGRRGIDKNDCAVVCQ